MLKSHLVRLGLNSGPFFWTRAETTVDGLQRDCCIADPGEMGAAMSGKRLFCQLFACFSSGKAGAMNLVFDIQLERGRNL